MKRAGIKVNWRAQLTAEEAVFIQLAVTEAEKIAQAQRDWTAKYQAKYQKIKSVAEKRARAGRRQS